MIDPTKYIFTEPLIIKGILDELKIYKDDYYIDLPITKDEDLQLHFKDNLIINLLIVNLTLV